MSEHKEYIARIESITGMSREKLNSLNPREAWKVFHGDAPIKVRSFFPAIGGGGSVIHSVSTIDPKKLDAAIDSLGK